MVVEVVRLIPWRLLRSVTVGEELKHEHVSYSLNSLKGGYIGDHIGA